jgi:dihydrofolate synthase/folylpolyglutamate synthase
VVHDYGTLVVGELDAEASAVAEEVAAERHARLVVAETFPLPMQAAGGFQHMNFGLAAAAAGALLGRPLDSEAVKSAAGETVVPGRLERVGERPLTLFDGAHNPSGADALAASLPELLGERRLRVAVIGVLEDKDAAGMLGTLLPHFDRVVFTRPLNPRALSPATLVTLAEKLGGPPAETVPAPHAALARARELAGPDGAVVATGSIYLIADLVREGADARASTL